jgi:hypothetical protein
MFRRGITPSDQLWDPILAGHASKDKIPSRKVLPSYSASTVSNYVIGIRADIEVPKTLLGHFRYRWGFLILKQYGHFPKPLVKWLSNRWKEDFSAMLLKYPYRYSEALRRITGAGKYRALGFVPAGASSNRGKRSKRPGKHDRIRGFLESVLTRPDRSGSPSTDLSGGGVRLR